MKYYWWVIYTSLLAAFTAVGLLGIFDWEASISDYLIYMIEVLGVIGLYGFVTERKIFFGLFWKCVLIGTVIVSLLPIELFVGIEMTQEDWLIFAFSITFVLPLMYGLYKYSNSFHSKT